jgi:homoserine O-acetyltransferase/O-succinyltransferase
MRGPVFYRFGHASRAGDAHAAFRVAIVATLVVIGGVGLAQEQREPVPQAIHSTWTANLVPAQADAFFDNYRLRNGETFEQLRLHYATLAHPIATRSARSTMP